MSATESAPTGSDAAVFDVVIVGAGFAGLYMLHKVRSLGLTARIYEAGSGVGGTWFWNRYPGARVDIESQEYSYSFSETLEEEWEWTERYASQPELLRYLNHVADRFDLRRDIQLETRVTDAAFDEASRRWNIVTNKGDRTSARFCIMATGCLSTPKDPDFPGVETFKGKSFHTGRWPQEVVDFTGQRVGVIGTGSSAVQSIPQIAEQASQLYVFQRTPNFSVPAHNRPLDPEVARDWKANRVLYRQQCRDSAFGIRQIDPTGQLALEAPPNERQRVYEDRWTRGGFSLVGAFADLVVSKEANDTAAAFVADKIRAIVEDPDVAEKLVSKSYPLATKRLCIDTGYYETFNRDNVTLVDVAATPIVQITPTGLQTSDRAYELDSIVYAIGFDAMTGALNNIDVRGRDGVSLQEKWSAGPRTYLGLMVAGFPNLFLITGPGSPSVLASMVLAIEQHVDWISACIGYVLERQLDAIEATANAEDGWVTHVNEVAEATLFPLANSWYLGANIPGKPRVFMPYVGGFPAYRQTCDEIAAEDYRGFDLSPSGRAP